jgi:hypothetical protein
MQHLYRWSSYLRARIPSQGAESGLSACSYLYLEQAFEEIILRRALN